MTRISGGESSDMSIPAGARVSAIVTLGPAGTSSEAAARDLTGRLVRVGCQPALTVLHPTYESAAAAVVDGIADLLVAANAYAQIGEFYMDPALRLAGAFHHRTPDYGIAADVTLAIPHVLRVASHPAPIRLIHELMPDRYSVREIVRVSSTSAAALAARSGQVDAALTTRAAAEIYGLRFISPTRPIEMLWSVFCSASRRGQRGQPAEVDIVLPSPAPVVEWSGI